MPDLKIYTEATSEYARIEAMRRVWRSEADDDDQDANDPPESPVRRYPVSSIEAAGGTVYQRCGGGYRVIRKRIGGG